MQTDQALGPSHLENFMREQDIPGEILHLDVPTPTVESAAAAVGTDQDSIVKSLLFTINDDLVLAIACGPTRIDRRAIATFFQVGRKKVKLADPKTVLEETGFQVGAMPPFGHFDPLSTLIDLRVLEKDEIYAGGGSDQTLLRISPHAILNITQAQVLDLLGPPQNNQAS